MKYSVRNTDNCQIISEKLSKMKEMMTQVQNEIEQCEYMMCQMTLKNDYKNVSSGSSAIISGVRQLADYLHKSPATAQKILNSNVLQERCIAYRVGNTWNIDKNKLDYLLNEEPQALKC